MILDEIVTELIKKRHDYYVNSKFPPKNEPKFVIYIGDDLYYDLKKEVFGPTPYNIENDTIYDFPVYVVYNGHNYWKIYEKE